MDNPRKRTVVSGRRVTWEKDNSGVPETTLKELEGNEIARYLSALNDAYDMGFIKEKFDPRYLGAVLLKEGREDFGTEQYDTNDKHAVATYNALVEKGHSPKKAKFPAAVVGTLRRAKHYGLPFGHIWYGRGKDEEGRTGADYDVNLQHLMPLMDTEENTGIVNFIRDRLPAMNKPEPIELPEQYSAGGRTSLI